MRWRRLARAWKATQLSAVTTDRDRGGLRARDESARTTVQSWTTRDRQVVAVPPDLGQVERIEAIVGRLACRESASPRQDADGEDLLLPRHSPAPDWSQLRAAPDQPSQGRGPLLQQGCGDDLSPLRSAAGWATSIRSSERRWPPASDTATGARTARPRRRPQTWSPDAQTVPEARRVEARSDSGLHPRAAQRFGVRSARAWAAMTRSSRAPSTSVRTAAPSAETSASVAADRL